MIHLLTEIHSENLKDLPKGSVEVMRFCVMVADYRHEFYLFTAPFNQVFALRRIWDQWGEVVKRPEPIHLEDFWLSHKALVNLTKDL